MNKKEFIETLIDMGGCGAEPKSWARGWDEAISEVLGIAEDLDEPTRIGYSPSLRAASINIGKAIQEGIDMVNQPSHYKGKHGLESIEIIQNFATDEMEMGFYWGNAIKYMTRYRNKNGLEDLKKARKNLDWLIEHMEGKK